MEICKKKKKKKKKNRKNLNLFKQIRHFQTKIPKYYGDFG